MKRVLMILMAATVVAAGVGARPMDREDSYVEGEMAAILEEQRATEVGSVTVGNLEDWSARLREAARKDAFIARSGGSSFMLPGLGQLKNGATGTGLLFLGGHLALAAGAILGSYFLLPADLRFDSLNYLRSPASTIEATWKAHSLLDYLPSVGVSLGGHLLDMGLRALAAWNARGLARERVDGGAAVSSDRR